MSYRPQRSYTSTMKWLLPMAFALIFVLYNFGISVNLKTSHSRELKDEFLLSLLKEIPTQPHQQHTTTSTDSAYDWPIQTMPHVVCNQSAYQTKIDQRRIPRFIIAGTQKGGTSALSSLLRLHPQVVPTETLEVHYFDYYIRKVKYKNPMLLRDKHICKRRRMYQEEFDIRKLLQHPNTITFDKTPKYLSLPFVARYVKRIAPWAKILITLRNPVDRAYSQWKMEIDRNRKIRTFDNLINKEMELRRNLGLTSAPTLMEFQTNPMKYNEDHYFQITPNNTLTALSRDWMDYTSTTTKYLLPIARGLYAQQLAYWLDYFPIEKRLKVIQYEKLRSNGQIAFQSILEFAELDPKQWDVDDSVFEMDFRPVEVEHTEDMVMSNTTRMYLEKVFKPYNDELADLLGEEWRGVWDSSAGNEN